LLYPAELRIRMGLFFSRNSFIYAARKK
jgi:hypothetical protein